MAQTDRLIRIAREILLPLGLLLACGTVVQFARMAWAVKMHPAPRSEPGATPENDPHFRQLLENSHVRVFAHTLFPGSESFVRYDHSFLTVTLDTSMTILWKNDESPVLNNLAFQGEVHFFLGKARYGTRNNSAKEYRNVTVEFLNPAVTNYGYRNDTGTWDYGPNVLHEPVDPAGHFANSLDLQKAVATDIQLLPKETLPLGKNPVLLIAVTPLNLSDGTGQKITLAPGEVAWRENTGRVTNAGPRTRFVALEFKP